MSPGTTRKLGDGDALAVALVTVPLAAIVRSFLRGRAPSAPVSSEPESQDRT